MKLSLFDYHLPKESIAQQPQSPRDRSRLLVYNCKTRKIEHRQFFQIIDYLKAGDVLVFNDSKVFPARLVGKKDTTGGRLEIFLLHERKMGEWEVLVGGKGKQVGLKVGFGAQLKAELVKRLDDKTWVVKFNQKGEAFSRLLLKLGKTPIPPYVKSTLKEAQLRQKYQTVYAKKIGSVAAPTAGFHFTKRLLKELNKKGVQCEFVTLHVGLGTFQSVTADKIEEHIMHSELATIKATVCKRLLQAKKDGRRIICVGTTSARTLEALWPKIEKNKEKAKTLEEAVNIFIYPGYKFRALDGLITNFHLPKSTLIMLVSAFLGRKKTLELYNLAVKKGYRFFSFGDAMFVF